MLPIKENTYIISNAIDIINQKTNDNNHLDRLIKQKTNLPKTVQLQIGTRVIFLNNSEYKHKIFNGIIRIITDINVELQEIRCAFCVQGRIVDIAVKKHTSSFIINGAPANSQMFEKGQAYVALSRCNNWNNIKIRLLTREAFTVDNATIKEYERLEHKASEPLPLSRPL
ncbi:2787_t:CDS:2 [Funneliformis caledonium]|uniref:2787_t:CDS:1 n=1 Tax=Funneliformis caledonium TaxID=1117310 RepID=A0A9N9DRX1_9GLOM|nr:2787_t:CDS:2 [Funneliformis caledonium]